MKKCLHVQTGLETLSLLRVINVKIPLQPHKKYDITQYGKLNFSYLTHMKGDYTTNSHYITHTIAFWKVGRIHILSSGVEGLTFVQNHHLIIWLKKYWWECPPSEITGHVTDHIPTNSTCFQLSTSTTGACIPTLWYLSGEGMGMPCLLASCINVFSMLRSFSSTYLAWRTLRLITMAALHISHGSVIGVWET